MNANDAAITAAREAERRLWKLYDLAVSERMIEVPEVGLRVRMLECGTPSAQPLVFVQGGLGEAFGWASLLAKLTDFRCVALDRPGGGFSDGVDFREVDMPPAPANFRAFSVIPLKSARGGPTRRPKPSTGSETCRTFTGRGRRSCVDFGDRGAAIRECGSPQASCSAFANRRSLSGERMIPLDRPNRGAPPP
jgi:hypothetical protein